MKYLDELRNPIWEALNGPHKRYAVGTVNAKHYPFEVTAGVGLMHNTDDDLRELARIVEPGQVVGVMGKSDHHTEQWITLASEKAVQMVCPERIPIPEHDVEIVTLNADDVPGMLELIALTRPGPFEKRTFEMGPYLGVGYKGQLVAMAGSRLNTPHFREISAVCTQRLRFSETFPQGICLFVSRYVSDDHIANEHP